VSESLQNGLWRMLGPHRGGRCVAVAGHPNEMDTFYFGACAGGVWRTSNAGETWRNLSDGQFGSASIGSISISKSDPEILYVGTGEGCVRADSTWGDGIYRSSNAGETWKRIGLLESGHIPSVAIDPSDPLKIYAAALGHVFHPSTQRGVYRSVNGGDDWQQVLGGKAGLGAADVAIDPFDSGRLFASLWDFQRTPWSVSSGGPGCDLYVSPDAGENWASMEGHAGWPSGLKGRIGIACSAARPGLVWAMVECETTGLYRSLDNGDSWELVNKTSSITSRPWYYMHVIADPLLVDRVYVLNVFLQRSDDGGKSFSPVSMPHNDHHALWINPDYPERMISGSDGGVCVSLNSGKSWSTRYNQPTSQFYGLEIDETEYPFRILGCQQDGTSLSVPSHTDDGAITLGDCHTFGGDECGDVSVDQFTGRIYAGGLSGRLTAYMSPEDELRNITVQPLQFFGSPAGRLPLRFNWNFPIVASKHAPDVAYVGANRLMRTADAGESWAFVSHDLTTNSSERLDSLDGLLSKEAFGGEYWCTITCIDESWANKDVLLVGTDDGLVWSTSDGGGNWLCNTPDELPRGAAITTIVRCRVKPERVYVACSNHRQGDDFAYVFRSEDAGISWTRIDKGLPLEPVRALAVDSESEGAVFVGTEFGLWVSSNFGNTWAPVPEGLPKSPISGISVQGRVLVVATYGRSIWAFDHVDLLYSILLQGAGPTLQEQARLLAPPSVTRARSQAEPLKVLGKAPAGVLYFGRDSEVVARSQNAGNPGYQFADAGDGNGRRIPLILSGIFRDAEIVISIAPDQPLLSDLPQEVTRQHLSVTETPSLRWWDGRYDSGRSWCNGRRLSYWGDRVRGPLAPAGHYEVILVIDGNVADKRRLEVLHDRRSILRSKNLVAQCRFLLDVRDLSSAVNAETERMTDLLSKLALQDSEGNSIAIQEITQIRDELAQEGLRGDVSLASVEPRINGHLVTLAHHAGERDDLPTAPMRKTFDELAVRAHHLLEQWTNIQTRNQMS